MTETNQTVENLINKYSQEWKTIIYPFLVVRIIHDDKKASSLEIKEKINKLAGKKIEYNYTSYYRLMARLEHELELIEPIDLIKGKGPARVYYGLTEKGKKLYEEILKQIIYPVQKVLPNQKS